MELLDVRPLQLAKDALGAPAIQQALSRLPHRPEPMPLTPERLHLLHQLREVHVLESKSSTGKWFA